MIKIKCFVLVTCIISVSCMSTQPAGKRVLSTVETPEIQTKLDSIPAQPVITGLDNFLENYIYLVHGKRVGLVTNSSAINSDFQLSIDLFYKNPEINLTTLFSLEHGIRGDASAGDKISDQQDRKTGLPVYSLYGDTKKPTQDMLRNIDVVIFDIQDAGIRSYTYIASMGMIIEAAAENNIDVIILDRPNPLGGMAVEGNIPDQNIKSLVCYYSIPYRYGMTIGELALMYNSEDTIGANLKVIPLKNWKRSMFWNETGLPWVPTSPHVPHWQTTLFMPLTGTIGELQTVNIGVGYTLPFELVGAPWINAGQLANSLNNLHLAGIYFKPAHYKPYYAVFKNEECHGVQIYITNPKSYKPLTAGLYIMQTLIKLYPDHDLFEYKDRVKAFNLVMGGDEIYEGLISEKSVEQMVREWQEKTNHFLKIRQKYLLYPD